MSTARELFEELGYEKAEKSESVVLYTNRYGDTISFKETKHVVMTPIQGCRSLTMTCLFENAIHQQCKELGWLEEEKQEVKQVTNLEYYKDEILENCIKNLAVVKGRPKLCYKTNCNDCDFKIVQGCHKKVEEWLKQTHIKPKYKLTQFEYDLLSVHKDFKTYNKISNQIHLFKMREKGYFKNIDTNIPIREILDNCEVVKDEKC